VMRTPSNPHMHPSYTPHAPLIHPSRTPHTPLIHPPVHPSYTPHACRQTHRRVLVHASRVVSVTNTAQVELKSALCPPPLPSPAPDVETALVLLPPICAR